MFSTIEDYMKEKEVSTAALYKFAGKTGLMSPILNIMYNCAIKSGEISNIVALLQDYKSP